MELKKMSTKSFTSLRKRNFFATSKILVTDHIKTEMTCSLKYFILKSNPNKKIQ